MRFISKYARFKAFPIHEKVEMLADGSVRQTRPGVVARFSHDVPLETHELKWAREHFRFTGTMLEEDEVTHIDPIVRVSVYDTVAEQKANGWSDEYREEIEASLRRQAGQDFIAIEAPMPAEPWPSYNLFSDPHKIAEMVVTLGLSPAEVARYEARNDKREGVILALAKIKEPEAEEVVAG